MAEGVQELLSPENSATLDTESKGRSKEDHAEEEEEQKMWPAVNRYGPSNIRDLKPGRKMKWCTCGLTKKAPWCDGSHKRTGFHSLKWRVPEKPQSVYQICNCCYTKSPPFCDGTHTNLPLILEERQKNCPKKDGHPECEKLCNSCGWVPDF
ncbi:CDGSH iron-sulfur domain-containing protein 3, mitochondrial [Holothuria leucospilota]|uniref:CDGSH iron-sulfur domain-containing protein 3, mitochondrial n=1 Tax=Holothuria leucospilota TaxID=206669 RepID=A0A9Q1HBR6_HOLLE|nr:CDGSH iron-sulfur domain-containing protein 3, mitochondrial [Holothuria leucospilota]